MKKIRTLKKYIKGYAAFSHSTIIARWGNNEVIKENWGDALNPYLIKFLSGKNPIYHDHIINVYNKPVHCVIGSYLGIIKKSQHVIIWGTGFGFRDAVLKAGVQAIHAVRGPLTGEKLRKQGIMCPEIYGDPALLYPMFYYPAIKPVYKLGIIAHVREKSHPWVTGFKDPDVNMIDITGGINHVVDEINKCAYIASSALHGLIAADAYGIPTLRLKISDKPLGDGFKYDDYFASVARESNTPLTVNSNTSKEDILEALTKTYTAPKLDAGALLNACPFLQKDQNFDAKRVFKRNTSFQ